MERAGYTSGEVASLLGLAEEDVRSLARSCLAAFHAADEPRFSLEELVLLRAAAALRVSGVTAGRARRALDRLREQLPRGRALAALRVSVEGREIRVRAGRAIWDAESGQGLLDFEPAGVLQFEVGDLARRAAPYARRRSEAAHAAPAGWSAEGWYELACELEAAEPLEAVRAYRRLLELVPDHAAAHLNLGRLLHEQGDVAAAEGHYRAALAARPDDAIAAFNLGVALEDRGLWAQAAAAYEAAIAADTAAADAYYNLSGVLERLGRAQDALRHLKTYRKLVRARAGT